MKALLTTLSVAAALAAAAAEQPASGPRATVVGFAVLPADTWAEGPPSGGFTAEGSRRRAPRFPGQPVQGISALRPGPEPGTYWALADNGFGTPANSPDVLLRIYLLRPRPRSPEREGDGSVEVVRVVQLADPNRRYPWRLEREWSGDRRFTGADLDPESLALDDRGGFWIGDEVGPFLLHFGADGALAEPPVELPSTTEEPGAAPLRSPHHPQLRAVGTEPGRRSSASVPSSGGLEGLARAVDGRTLLALLEKPVHGDPRNALRIYRFEPATRSFAAHVHAYRLEDPSHHVGELAVLDEDHVLVLERDDAQGDEASFKRVHRLDLRTGATRLVADLLHLADPHDLTGHGDPFALPYATIESLVVLDAHTLLVATDNNFPSTGARGDGVPNATEMVWIRLEKPLGE